MDGAAAIVNGIGARDRVGTNVNTFQNWNIHTIHHAINNKQTDQTNRGGLCDARLFT